MLWNYLNLFKWFIFNIFFLLVMKLWRLYFEFCLCAFIPFGRHTIIKEVMFLVMPLTRVTSHPLGVSECQVWKHFLSAPSSQHQYVIILLMSLCYQESGREGVTTTRRGSIRPKTFIFSGLNREHFSENMYLMIMFKWICSMNMTLTAIQ